jgi:hypothetical protein
MVLRRVVGLLVDPHDEGAVDALSGGGDDDLLRAGLEVRGHLRFLPEFARRLQHDVDADPLPGQQRTIVCDVGDPDLPAVDDKRLVAEGDFAREFPVDGVVLEKVGKDRGFCPRIDGDDFDVVVPEGGPDEISSDSAETIHCALDTHVSTSCSNFELPGPVGLREDEIFGCFAWPDSPRVGPGCDRKT